MISDFLAVPERADSYEQNSMIAHPQAQYGDRYLAPRIHAVLFVPRVYTIGTELNKRMPHIVQLRVFRGLVSHAETWRLKEARNATVLPVTLCVILDALARGKTSR